MFRNVTSDKPMGSPTLFWGLMLSVSTICICSTYGEGEYLFIFFKYVVEVF